jgi:hypothetical protein
MSEEAHGTRRILLGDNNSSTLDTIGPAWTMNSARASTSGPLVFSRFSDGVTLLRLPAQSHQTNGCESWSTT